MLICVVHPLSPNIPGALYPDSSIDVLWKFRVKVSCVYIHEYCFHKRLAAPRRIYEVLVLSWRQPVGIDVKPLALGALHLLELLPVLDMHIRELIEKTFIMHHICPSSQFVEDTDSGEGTYFILLRVFDKSCLKC